MSITPIIDKVTKRIKKRSIGSRENYLKRMEEARIDGVARAHLSCSNQAHAYAAFSSSDKNLLVAKQVPNIGIINAYNDMLSAHQPFKDYPDMIKRVVHELGATAQVAGGVPAMCDGVTQGQPGMELSLFSRDAIAMSATIALSHNCFDACVYLGVCDKIVPGMVIAAASFGHLPAIFIPAGPMTSGLSNAKKAQVRQQFARREIDREALLKAEMKAYHGSGTCTFYGTANTNQMLMEFLGLQLPGGSFVNPETPLRESLTRAGIQRILAITDLDENYIPVADILTAEAFVNGIVGLFATGGSTNLVIHIIAMARAAGLKIKLEDFAELSNVVPVLAKIYPNGQADVNHFHAAGGLPFVIYQLLSAGLLHEEVTTVCGCGLSAYTREPGFDSNESLSWHQTLTHSLDVDILRPVADPFQQSGGLVCLSGELGQAVMKVSALDPRHYLIEAPAKVFNDQPEVKAAFSAGELACDFICVLLFQGPKANGMPELHSLTPILSILQSQGFQVALITDGRMSGASGSVPAAVHLTPEAAMGGNISKIRDGDLIRIDVKGQSIQVLAQKKWINRKRAKIRKTDSTYGHGRELFKTFRDLVGTASQGASVFNYPE